MENINLVKQISDDLTFLKKKVVAIEERIEEIDDDLHAVRPAYLEKLKKLEKEPTKKYKNLEELEKDLKKD